MVDVNTERLNDAAQATYGLDYAGAMRRASGLNLDPEGICYALYGKALNACFAELLGDGTLGSPGLLMSHALLLDGTSGCWCTTPDAVALDIVGDIDLRVEFQAFPGGGVTQTFISKWTTTGNQRSYRMGSVFGLLTLHWSSTGIDDISDSNTTVNPSSTALRTTLDVVNGVNHVSQYFAGQTLGLGTSIVTNTVAGNTSIFSSSAVAGLGGDDGGTNPFKGRITRAEIRNGLDGTVVANPDFRNLAPGTTSFVDGAGLTWTLQGTAKVV